MFIDFKSDASLKLDQGAASFVKKTVFGLSNSLTKMTSSVGKGLSAATMDADYQAKRRMAQRRNRPRHALLVLFNMAIIDRILSSLLIVLASLPEPRRSRTASLVELRAFWYGILF